MKWIALGMLVIVAVLVVLFGLGCSTPTNLDAGLGTSSSSTSTTLGAPSGAEGTGGHQPSDSSYVRPTTPPNSGRGMLMRGLWHR